MSTCDRVLERLDDALAGTLPAELSAHVAGCAACRDAVERARLVAGAPGPLGGLRAPDSLVSRIAAMPRLALGCERVVEGFDDALDGRLEGAERRAFVDHLRSCPACQAGWEAFATLRQVGAATRVADDRLAALAVHPSARLDVRRRKKLVDLRLATAAAYLVAALTVMLIGNPGTIARAGTAHMELATRYARAAVENRYDAYKAKITETAAATLSWAKTEASDLWQTIEKTFSRQHKNPPAAPHVVPDDSGGSR